MLSKEDLRLHSFPQPGGLHHRKMQVEKGLGKKSYLDILQNHIKTDKDKLLIVQILVQIQPNWEGALSTGTWAIKHLEK